MTPALRLHIISLVTNLKAARDEHRGVTVPAIRSGGPFDGRARTEYAIADPPDTRDVPDEEYPPEKSQFERDCWRDKGC